MSKVTPISGTTRLVAIFGWPLTYTLSPAMQNRALVKSGIDALYVALPSPAEKDFLGLAKGLQSSPHFIGANITNPYKRAALKLGKPSATAKAIGAANTLYRAGGRWHCDNTDAPGFLAALKREGIALRGRDAIVLGAGGAARAISFALGRAGARSVTVLARRASQAQATAKLAGRKGRTARLQGSVLRDLGVSKPLVINTLPSTELSRRLASHLPKLKGGIAVDISYVPLWTPFLKTAHKHGWQPVSGLSMLREQGFLAFARWFGPKAAAQIRPFL